MRVKPAQLISRASTNRVPKDGLIGIYDGELLQKLLCFTKCVSLLENHMATNWPRGARHELDERLVRNSYAVLLNAASENVECNPLLLWKAVVKTVDENVRVNESGHERKDPLWSSRGFQGFAFP